MVPNQTIKKDGINNLLRNTSIKLVCSKHKEVTMQTQITIRSALESDGEWVIELMHAALEPFYDGDHRAHGRRIFNTHMAGGHDDVGFFSYEQRMFIAEVGGRRAGMIHLVGKRQQTYKISPLIVVPEFRGCHGLGSQLLAHAETYASEQSARQIYCTVAERNLAALQFFIRKGFIRAGSSDSHYKSGVTEIMLYKQLTFDRENMATELANISVLPLEEGHQQQVSTLLLSQLPQSFDGVDEAWVQGLYAGYKRRDSGDVNDKYKIIFVAMSAGKVIGIAAASPKKGSPIKLMPLVAKNIAAFDALLSDVPFQLVPFGHKLYVHINPTAEQVTSLQRFGWKLDAALPSAYRNGIITYQWSLTIGETTMRMMRIKRRFFDLMKSGQKDLEARVGYPSMNRIQAGEQINWVNGSLSLITRVRQVRKYKTFVEMLQNERYERIIPDCHSSAEALALLTQIYPPEKEKLGVIVLELHS